MGEAIAARWMALRAEVAKHKKAIKESREALVLAARALDDFEHDCRQRGLAIHVTPAAGAHTGAGAIHGRTRTGS